MKQLLKNVIYAIVLFFTENFKYIMPVELEIERPSGTFYFHDQELTRCQAARECAKTNTILAPITEKSDFTALSKAYNDYEGAVPKPYHIGLEIARDNSGRVFSNGVEWNQKKHGSFYTEADYQPDSGDCLNAFMVPEIFPDELVIDYKYKCERYTSRFICFKPKTASSSEGLKFANDQVSLSYATFFAIIGAAGFLVCCALGVATYFYKTRFPKKDPNET